MILKLTNNKNTYSFEVEDLNNGEKLFYHFQIPTSDMEDGNYKMVLLDGDEIITEEQVCIGAYNPQAIQYSRGENVYINAPFEANLEDVKEVEITAIETTVLPSEGYDGIKAVEVNAQPIFDEGYNVGNAEGIEVGKAEQKALLEPITITENGTYENENGYSTIEVNVPDVNGSYDEGYTDGYAEGEAKGVENAGEIIAETARVLDITENGYYMSRYSEPPFEKTGDNFFNYTHLTNVSYDTGVVIDKNSIIEFWIKPYELIISSLRTVFGLTEEWRIYTDYSTYNVYIGDVFGLHTFNGSLKLNEWNHIVFNFAKNEGLFNGEKITNVYFEDRLPEGKTLVINGDKYYHQPFDGYFGMIKINDIVFIPTENGFLNTTTGEYLQKRSEGEYEYFAPVMPSGNLIKTVKVNVIPKINVAKERIKFAYSSFTTVPEWADFSNITDMSYMFHDCSNLTSIPLIDTSNVTNMYYIFRGCFKLTSIPQLDTSNVNSVNRMFYGCSNLTSVPPLNAQNITSNEMFGYGELTKLTDFGGLIGLKVDFNGSYSFNKCPNLTYQSCINILNGLADVTELGSRTLKVHPNFLTNVGDEISIGTSKNWIITA